ncbi:class I SAM-dependent methyltransferase [Mycoavidus sp. B2-EB]|uniref:class I SAM-dependent methyltransferase n=1 Tax=Mycoavidus sp. B2-EB TaxID=2651972 RepID=UPI0016286D2E|nr:methyltransferase domain-containing protein [Mycoavidus sp. B2-EB]BBO60316.1 hypothetical protein MPB2EB_1456 [Mycoavidus sp. B2-EB]
MPNQSIIDWSAWAASAPGRYVLAWEQAQLDRLVSDIFGYYALQLGLPQLDALRENRMPSRAVVLNAELDLNLAAEFAEYNCVWCELPELPFASQSIDLLILPHTLELTCDPHRLLREAERVLLPEGQLVILGFNTMSLWGARQALGRLMRRSFVPAERKLIAFSRLKDWLKLLGFELNRGRFGCYQPPFGSEQWLTRFTCIEQAGDRWWPVLGAVYMITAIKRVRGMRLIGAAPRTSPALAPALPPVATSQTQRRK